ncbi:MAG: hypothetical protein FWC43_13340 [Planctomycetaceae bacterium]|nr:hypothetical protein [Planctomycetaceae bacterium]
MKLEKVLKFKGIGHRASGIGHRESGIGNWKLEIGGSFSLITYARMPDSRCP